MARRGITAEREAAEATEASMRPRLDSVESREAPAERPEKCALRVCIVSDSPAFTPPYIMGGTERQLSDLSLALKLGGYEVTVVARATPECALRAGAPTAAGALRTRYV